MSPRMATWQARGPLHRSCIIGTMTRPSRRELLRTLGLLPLSCAANSAEAVTFTDIATQAGLSRARNLSGSPVDKKFLVEEMGGGFALFDFDNVGWLDIF